MRLSLRCRVTLSFGFGLLVVTSVLAIATWNLASGYMLRQREAKALWVSDTEAAEAMRFAYARHGLVVEPGGAAALAALLAGKVPPLPDTVVVVSGGNVDPELHARITAQAA